MVASPVTNATGAVGPKSPVEKKPERAVVLEKEKEKEKEKPKAEPSAAKKTPQVSVLSLPLVLFLFFFSFSSYARSFNFCSSISQRLQRRKRSCLPP